MDYFYSYFCSIIACYSPFFILCLVVLGVVLIVLNRKKKSKKADAAYYLRVLEDLENLREKGDIDAKSYNQLKAQFNQKLKNVSQTRDSYAEGNQKVEKPLKVEPLQERRVDERKKPSKLKSANLGANLLLYLGSFLVISAALILIAFNWEQFEDYVKAFILPVFTGLFFLFGLIFYKLKKVKSAGVTFLIISNILIPLSFISIWRFILEDYSGLEFWIYWFFVSAIFLVLSFLYNLFIQNVVSKLILVLGLNSLIFSAVFAFDFGVLLSVLFICSLNLIVFTFYKNIRDKFLRRSVFVFSQVLNSLLFIYAFFVLFLEGSLALNVELFLFEQAVLNQVLSLLVLFLPIFFCAVSYIKTYKSLFYFPVLPLAIASIGLFGYVWKLSIEQVSLLLTIVVIFAYCYERLFSRFNLKFEKNFSFIFAITLPYLLTCIIGVEDILNTVQNYWIYFLGAVWVLYYLLRYIKEKNAAYLGLASVVSLYPILKFAFSLDYVVDYFCGILVFSLSVITLILSIGLNLFKARRSSLSLLPVFYFLNVLGLLCIPAKGASSALFGLFLAVSALIYILKSLFVLNGRLTQISVFWLLGSIIFISSEYLSTIEIAGIYVLFGFLSYFGAELIRLLKRKWKVLPEEELVNLFYDLITSGYLLTLLSFLIGMMAAVTINSFGSFLIITLQLLFFIFLAYRYRNRKWLWMALIFQLIWLCRFVVYFEVPVEFSAFLLLTTSAVSYLLASFHEKVFQRLQEFSKTYLNLGLFFTILVYLVTLFGILGTCDYPVAVRAAILIISTIIVALHGLKVKSVLLHLVPIYFLNLTFWRILVDFDITNPQYYFLCLGLSFHATNIVLRHLRRGIAKINLFDILGVVTILGISLLQSFSEGKYLLLLIAEGAAYTIIWSYLNKKTLATLSIIIVIIGVVIQLFNLVISFPQWLVLGISGLVILAVGVIFLFVKKDR